MNIRMRDREIVRTTRRLGKIAAIRIAPTGPFEVLVQDPESRADEATCLETIAAILWSTREPIFAGRMDQSQRVFPRAILKRNNAEVSPELERDCLLALLSLPAKLPRRDLYSAEVIQAICARPNTGWVALPRAWRNGSAPKLDLIWLAKSGRLFRGRVRQAFEHSPLQPLKIGSRKKRPGSWPQSPHTFPSRNDSRRSTAIITVDISLSMLHILVEDDTISSWDEEKGLDQQPFERSIDAMSFLAAQ
ncbi:uncharacterized protein CIMG_11377 [Coccidioides immitis RS]|uniref:Uncharacterized protein n=1 Tax=Coccidioides immitis (strain RS) TaxID=246410 RepID=A0A0D8JUJ6_COCIM|nr:uncharacterized protein CIMG_11377 [Coccidioides immitis RS]KJF61025.1 hypothetical protein CIMG_11377 [Coccidioides immitis RS]